MDFQKLAYEVGARLAKRASALNLNMAQLGRAAGLPAAAEHVLAAQSRNFSLNPARTLLPQTRSLVPGAAAASGAAKPMQFRRGFGYVFQP